MPSSCASLWQAMLAELCQSADGCHDQRTGIGRRWRPCCCWPRWPAGSGGSCSACWPCAGSGCGAGRCSTANLLELVDALRAELGCQRPVEARQSDDLATAATIGWRRPVVLLPADWTTWTADQRRAVLAHEIAHARSHDFLALLFGQLGLVLHFYHPLLHWLMGRLRLEQELAADAAAASVSGGQRQYLATIAELALRQQDRPAVVACPHVSSYSNHFLEENCHAQGFQTPFRSALAGGATDNGRGHVVVRAVGCRPARAERLDRTRRGPMRKSRPVADDSIDTTYMIEKASMIVVMRPAAVFSRPELAPLAKLLEASGNMVPRETHLADFRQITVIMPEADIPSGPREIVVLQWVKPIAEAELAKRQPARISPSKSTTGRRCTYPPRRWRRLLHAYAMIIPRSRPGRSRRWASIWRASLGSCPSGCRPRRGSRSGPIIS